MILAVVLVSLLTPKHFDGRTYTFTKEQLDIRDKNTACRIWCSTKSVISYDSGEFKEGKCLCIDVYEYSDTKLPIVIFDPVYKPSIHPYGDQYRRAPDED